MHEKKTHIAQNLKWANTVEIELGIWRLALLKWVVNKKTNDK